ncbi:MAG: ATP-binding cassette domain-containing protein [Holophagaceae bacterium]|nr:ATP-binding cassette domain-containing protein [Holophagaceae bacterium]
MDIAIEVQGLSKRFHGQAEQDAVALDNISLSIPSGSIAGLVGPDGAGKTTLLRLMAGLLEPTSGSISVLGMNPYKDGDKLRADIGYMPQKFGLYEDLSVIENLNLYADLRSVVGPERERLFKQLLAFTDLARFTKRYAGKLSGGMKQKLGLACTLLGTPKILLLDEPGVGVDPISRRELWRMVRELSAAGMTVLWSTSYLDEAELCDSVCLMNQGKIVANDAPSSIKSAMQGRCLHIANISGNRRNLLMRALRAPEVIDGVIQGANVRLVTANIGVYPDLGSLRAGTEARLVEVEPRLEDAFISLLGGSSDAESALAAAIPDVELPPNIDPDAVIEAKQLTKKFGDFTATDSVSFSVKKGEIFGLLGPNGAGKSTTFKMKCGLLKPTEGKALVMGIDLKKSPSEARQRLGYMAQKFSLYGQLSVKNNLIFFSGIYGLQGEKQKTKIQQMIDVFALHPYLDLHSGQLPLGIKQRLALACAMMHEPEMLFLDEPTSGVDPVARREFWSHINGLANRGVTVMVTTHFMDEAEYCDRIALVYRGKLIALGTPDDLKRSVKSDTNPTPTMEDAFIELVRGADNE